LYEDDSKKAPFNYPVVPLAQLPYPALYDLERFADILGE
jgi:hypothetical protein